MFDFDDDEPDTLKSCEACGGNWKDGCHWCSHGFMNVDQIVNWREFKIRIHNESDVYSLVQNLVEIVADKLIFKIPNSELYEQYFNSLSGWIESDPNSDSRLTNFNKIIETHKQIVNLICK